MERGTPPRRVFISLVSITCGEAVVWGHMKNSLLVLEDLFSEFSSLLENAGV